MLLTYLFDPLCGWCHGAAPVLAALRAADFSLRLSPTGLFSGDGARTLTADALSHIREADQRIAQASGQPFSQAYQNTLLVPGARLDSTVPTLALTAVAETAADREFEALGLIQTARYDRGLDTTDTGVTAQVLEDGDFAEAATLLREGPPFLTARNDARVSLGRRLLAGVGAGGVPTLVVVRDEDRVVVPSGMLYGDPKPLIQALTDL